MKIIFRTIMIFSLLALTGYRKPGDMYKNFSVQKLGEGAWAIINNDRSGYAICNAGIVDLGDKTIVFDAFINLEAAAELKKAAEELTHKPVTLLINSHFHDDHIRGNQVFSPRASIISTDWTRHEMEKNEPEEQEWARKNNAGQVKKAKEQLQSAPGTGKDEAAMWVNYYEAIGQSLPFLKTKLPDITFHDSLWIYGTKRNVLLVECRGGHTGSDAVMLIPMEGIAFMGDILFSQRHPWLSDGEPESWKKHLEKFYADSSLHRFIPGHGPVTDKEGVRQMIQYIGDLQHMAATARQNNETDSSFIKKPIPEAYKNWWFGRFYKGNLDFMYTQTLKK
jgi:cyclase